ncbi:MAG: histidine kinase [Myxococcota bacterium]
MVAWLGFWVAVILLDIAYDVLQLLVLEPANRDLSHLPREWTVFWGSWLVVSAPAIALPAWLERMPALRIGVAVVAAGMLAAVHLTVAATTFAALARFSVGPLGLLRHFALTLGARDLLLAGALIAVLSGWRTATQARRARLAALDRKLRPHFVFNTLNGLSGVLRAGDHQTAVEIVARLGSLLRAELDHPEVIELRRELDNVRDYFRLESLRVGGRMHIEWQIEGGTEHALVPSFVIQPLAENAVRHGVERTPEPVRILVRAQRLGRRLRLQIDDTGPGLGRQRLGVGLPSVRSRLQLAYGHRAACAIEPRPGGGTRSTLTVPYVTGP